MSFIPPFNVTGFLTVEFQPYGGVKGGGGRTPLGETDVPAHGRLEDDSRIERSRGLRYHSVLIFVDLVRL